MKLSENTSKHSISALAKRPGSFIFSGADPRSVFGSTVDSPRPDASLPLQTFDTPYMEKLLRGVRAGDAAARNELIRAVSSRLEVLTERMLRKFPNVGRWAEAGDVYQGSAMRLLKSLETMAPADTRAFLNLAAVHVRRELLDLARRFYGPEGIGANHDSLGANLTGFPRGLEWLAIVPGADDLESWTAFHEVVGALPPNEREVFNMAFYHGWKQTQMAELFGVDERTIRRRWRAACLMVNEKLGHQLPEL